MDYSLRNVAMDAVKSRVNCEKRNESKNTCGELEVRVLPGVCIGELKAEWNAVEECRWMEGLNS